MPFKDSTVTGLFLSVVYLDLLKEFRINTILKKNNHNPHAHIHTYTHRHTRMRTYSNNRQAKPSLGIFVIYSQEQRCNVYELQIFTYLALSLNPTPRTRTRFSTDDPAWSIDLERINTSELGITRANAWHVLVYKLLFNAYTNKNNNNINHPSNTCGSCGYFSSLKQMRSTFARYKSKGRWLYNEA